MLVVAAQLNPVIGDIAANSEMVAAGVAAARRAGARLLVTPELGLLGYPPRDLVLRAGVAEGCVRAAERLAAAYPEMTMLLGLVRPTPDGPRPCANSIALCRGGAIQAFYDKRLLPTYDIFDEERYFTPGHAPLVFDFEGRRIGVLICEDLWRAVDAGHARRYRDDPAAEAIAAGAEVLLVASASPFVIGKHQVQQRLAAEASRRLGVPVLICNQVGGNDDLIFDGGSMLALPARSGITELARFQERIEVFEIPAAGEGHSPRPDPPPTEPMAEVWSALLLGVSDYLRKTGHSTVVVGLSGGIDSALVAALASAAIGPMHVHGLLMPGPYSSSGSLVDSIEVAERLGLASREVIGITEAHGLLRGRFERMLGTFEGVADENLQSRLRGLTLMAFSNATGALVLTTGNKSELATGYATLYGDMSGGLAPIGDLLKTQVYELTRFVNAHWEQLGFRCAPIPEASLSKPPSAELRPDQTDQDTLPPYDQLDRLIDHFVHKELDPATIAHRCGEAPDFVQRWCQVIDREQYKRDQAPVILKVSARAFGRGRPMPIVARSRGVPRADP
ncbi:MAG: NAD+ synthase [Phycisphaeraceae bacterium]|nr:NAD+ synthase [Phycisphaeraceae bacterium]